MTGERESGGTEREWEIFSFSASEVQTCIDGPDTMDHKPEPIKRRSLVRTLGRLGNLVLTLSKSNKRKEVNERRRILKSANNIFFPNFATCNFLALKYFFELILTKKKFGEVYLFVALEDIVSEDSARSIKKNDTLAFIVDAEIGYNRMRIPDMKFGQDSLPNRQQTTGKRIQKNGFVGKPDALRTYENAVLQKMVDIFLQKVVQGEQDGIIPVMKKIYLNHPKLNSSKLQPVEIDIKSSQVRLKDPGEYTMSDISRFIGPYASFKKFPKWDYYDTLFSHENLVTPTLLDDIRTSWIESPSKHLVENPVDWKSTFSGTFVSIFPSQKLADFLDMLDQRHADYKMDPASSYYFSSIFAADFCSIYKKNNGHRQDRVELQKKYDDIFNIEIISSAIGAFSERVFVLAQCLDSWFFKDLPIFYEVFQILRCRKSVEVICSIKTTSKDFQVLGRSNMSNNEFLELNSKTALSELQTLDPSRLSLGHTDDRHLFRKQLIYGGQGFKGVIDVFTKFLKMFLKANSVGVLKSIDLSFAKLVPAEKINLAAQIIGHAMINSQTGDFQTAKDLTSAAVRNLEVVDDLFATPEMLFLLSKAKVLRTVYSAHTGQILLEELASVDPKHSSIVDEAKGDIFRLLDRVGAKQHFLKALTTVQDDLWRKANLLLKIAETYMDTGEHLMAKKYCDVALEAISKYIHALSHSRPNVFVLQYKILYVAATALLQMKDLAGAEKEFDLCRCVAVSRYGENNALYADAMLMILRVLYEQNKFKEIVRGYETTEPAIKNFYGTQSLQFWSVLHLVGVAYKAEGDQKRASYCFKQCLEYCKQAEFFLSGTDRDSLRSLMSEVQPLSSELEKSEAAQSDSR